MWSWFLTFEVKSIYLRERENAWYTFWVWPDCIQATPIALGSLHIDLE